MSSIHPEYDSLEQIQQLRMFTMKDFHPTLYSTLITHEQLSVEWFKQRKKRITGSKLSQFLFMNSVTDAQQLYDIIFNGAPREPMDELGQTRCAFGRKHEIHAICSFLREFKDLYYMDVSFKLHPQYPTWLGCTSDGLVADKHTREIKLVEIKCPYGEFEGKNAKAFKAFPEYYIPQIVMQQLCYNIQTTLFVIWTKQAFKVYEVKLDPTYAQSLMIFLKEFYNYVDLCTNEAYLLSRIEALKAQTREFKKKHVTNISPRGGFKTSHKFNEHLKAFYETQRG